MDRTIPRLNRRIPKARPDRDNPAKTTHEILAFETNLGSHRV